MSEVNVTINARQYRMACEDGQEEHLLKLSQDLDQRIAQLRASFGEVGDTRLTVMAALTVADELAEAGKTIRRLEEELAGLKDARVHAADRSQATQAALIAAFNSAAARIEGLTRKLNQTIGGEVAMGGCSSPSRV
jgi:cell division protein ZapA